jgi:hypothetical protein
VTPLTFDGEALRGVTYAEPAAALLGVEPGPDLAGA